MSNSFSPLRYPGGKQVLAPILAHLIALNKREGGIYAESYAGGAGAALSLLFGEHVEQLMLNDADPHIYAFWKSLLSDTDEFLKLVRDTPLSVSEWEKQKTIYRRSRCSLLKRGFATFYLNRCNRSGIIDNAGIIGGRDQTGKWKLDARFNRKELAARIERVARYRDRIRVFNLDAIEFLRNEVGSPSVAGRAFVYLDPPYYVKGSQLYLNHYKPADHGTLACFVKSHAPYLWVMSYDNVPEIQALYQGLRQVPFNLAYSAQGCRVGKEVMILCPNITFPERWQERIPDRYVSTSGYVSIPMAG